MMKYFLAENWHGILKFNRLDSFDRLWELDLEKVAREISPKESNRSAVLQMISEYHDNLAKAVSEFGALDEAVQSALKRNKNVPAQYHSAIKELVRNCCVDKEKR